MRVGLVDTWFGVLLTLSFVAYSYMLRALIAGFEHCARNLGDGTLRSFVKLEHPFLLPGAAAGRGLEVSLVLQCYRLPGGFLRVVEIL